MLITHVVTVDHASMVSTITRVTASQGLLVITVRQVFVLVAVAAVVVIVVVSVVLFLFLFSLLLCFFSSFPVSVIAALC